MLITPKKLYCLPDFYIAKTYPCYFKPFSTNIFTYNGDEFKDLLPTAKLISFHAPDDEHTITNSFYGSDSYYISDIYPYYVRLCFEFSSKHEMLKFKLKN